MSVAFGAALFASEVGAEIPDAARQAQVVVLGDRKSVV